MNPHPFIIIITGLLILLWAYASFSKIFDMHKFQHALMTQVFPRWVGKILTYVLPLTEIALIVLLLIPQTRLTGMYSSLFLMGVFTLYVGGAVFQIYERYPCACGGLFARMGWYKHFKVNIILTLIALAGVILMEY
ncbi:general stress protein CsbA [Pedobacter cryoconitis]|uniref:General stress protein CsbA n=1 Tax=Pedobacter cryoconitis TaxID=188932 RepID=A0A7W8ZPW4_9SPHI|nr:MauE/DoxX family redox-associated membrane protein [Pedobacter cryoconitis]MBB5637843.1 general stress protein CsbA [Pedobacter cryoconitis]